MGALFRPSANLAVPLALLAGAGVVAAALGWWWLAPRTDYARGLHWTVDQPVPFSHEHHVAGLGIDCRFCHGAVEVAASAGLPPTYTCMTCHSEIWTNAALLAPVRDSLANDRPIVWRRVNALPDYVYFNHAIHIDKGVGCATCHGAVDRLPLMSKQASFTMSFCVDCHRDPGPQLRPRQAIFDTEWQRTPATPPPAALLAQYHLPDRNLTDCSICHR